MSFAASPYIFKIRFDYTQTPKPEYSEPKVDLSITVSAIHGDGYEQTFAEVAIYDNNDNWYTFDVHGENYEDIVTHGHDSDVMTGVSARQYAAILDSIDNIANLVSIVPLQKI
tara:strand:+ start:372 stop:710 length:339 start_codon:yes stop_codon:yes gene_type:complete